MRPDGTLFDRLTATLGLVGILAGFIRDDIYQVIGFGFIYVGANIAALRAKP